MTAGTAATSDAPIAHMGPKSPTLFAPPRSARNTRPPTAPSTAIWSAITPHFLKLPKLVAVERLLRVDVIVLPFALAAPVKSIPPRPASAAFLRSVSRGGELGCVPWRSYRRDRRRRD